MRILMLFISLLLSFNTNYSQQSNKSPQKAPIILEEGKNPAPVYTTCNVLPDGNYIIVDTMGNAFSPAIGSLNPLAFDPYSGTLAFVHRGGAPYGAGGEIWYNISTDFGASWRRVGCVNAIQSAKNGRYPSMCISNPTHSGISSTKGVFGWAELLNSAFGAVGAAFDQPIGANAGNSIIINPVGSELFSSIVTSWSADNSPYVFGSAEDFNTSDLYLIRTADFVNIEKLVVQPWSTSDFQMGGASYQNTQYFGFVTTNSITTGPAYSKSTDNGLTWSALNICDWRTIPALARFDKLFDYIENDAFVSYQGDINVDYNGKVHMIVQLTDTNIASNALVELYETSTGWSGNIIYEGLNADVYRIGPGIGQMGPSGYLAMDASRQIMAVQWVNKSSSTQWADIYIAYKRVTETTWSAPINLTNSPNINNTQSHLAPFLKNNGNGSYTAFSMYGYQLGATGPSTDSTLATGIYVAPVTFTPAPVPVELKSFTAVQSGKAVKLSWSTATELNNYGFNVERKTPGNNWTTVAFVKGNGTTINENSYTYLDELIKQSGRYSYRLKQMDLDGTSKYISEAEVSYDISLNNYELWQNYPNPFNPSTIIAYNIPEESDVVLKVFDPLGNEVTTLVNERKPAGKYEVNFDAGRISNGVYFYRITANNYTAVKKLVLMR